MKSKGEVFDTICEISAVSKTIQDLKLNGGSYSEIQKAQQHYDRLLDEINET